jgi:hypothetical protein
MREPRFRRTAALLGEPGSHLARLVSRAGRLAALDRDLRARLPRPLADHCQVANLRENSIILHADSPVWAARLRYQRAMLLEALAALGLPQVREVAIRVRPAAPAAEQAPQPPSRPAAAPPAEREAGVRDPRLAAALRRLGSRLRR